MIYLGKQASWEAIDKSFVEHLKGRLDEGDWQKLMDAGSEDLRPRIGPFSHAQAQPLGAPGPVLRLLLLDRFQGIKERFDEKHSKLGWPLQLPRGVGHTNDESRGINNGVLKLTP